MAYFSSLLWALMLAGLPLGAALAQATGGVGIGTTTPDASAALDITSTTQGVLVPRLTTTQRDGLASKTVGLLIFNTTTLHFNAWNGQVWEELLNSAATSAPVSRTLSFTYTGQTQTFMVPAGVTSLTVVATGAAAGSLTYSPYPTAAGGLGASVSTSFMVVPGEVLTLNVGGMNGYNGGGAGKQGGLSGGGATDVRRAPAGTPLGQAGAPGYADQLVVAAGGGGAAFDGGGYAGASGGNGGTPNGGAGSSSAGATQTAPGGNGSRGQGGAGGTGASIATGGGGGGYYGGGGGTTSNMPAGHGRSSGSGGSSWSATAATYTQAPAAANGSLTITYAGVDMPTLDGSNLVNVPGDNLGNHTATQDLTLASHQLLGASHLGVVNSGGAEKYNLSYTANGLNLSESNVAAGRLFVQDATGNVGLGTTSPTQKLDVSGNTSVTGNAYVTGSLGLGTAAPTQKLDVRGNLRLGNDGSGATGVGQVLEFVGPGFNTDPVGLYRVNTATDASQLRVVVGEASDANDQFAIGRSAATAEGGIGSSAFTPVFTVQSSGNVGIGTGSPSQKLVVQEADGTYLTDIIKAQSFNQASAVSLYYAGLRASGSNTSDVLYLDSKGTGILALNANGGTANVGIGTKTPGYKLDVAGDINASGNVRSSGNVITSDARFKTDVRPLGGALAGVLALRGVRYRWNALGVRRGGQAGAEQMGLLAQELEKVYPELVSTGPDGYKAVNYAQLAPVLIEALKEQQAQIEALKQQAAAATQRATRAEASLGGFERRLRALEAGGVQAQASK